MISTLYSETLFTKLCNKKVQKVWKMDPTCSVNMLLTMGFKFVWVCSKGNRLCVHGLCLLFNSR